MVVVELVMSQLDLPRFCQRFASVSCSCVRLKSRIRVCLRITSVGVVEWRGHTSATVHRRLA